MMTHRRHALSMLLVCISMAACDGVDDVDAPGARLLPEEIEHAAQIGMSPQLSGTPTLASAVAPELALELPSFAGPETTTAGHVNKVKRPRAEHLIGWVRWANAQPDADGAVADPTGEKCGMGQQGSVWYLAGTWGGAVERECDIPNGKKLVFPLVNTWCVFPPEFYPDAASIEADLPYVEDWFDEIRSNACGLTLRIDGQEVRPSFAELEQDFHISVSEPFEIDLHDEHWAPDVFAGGEMPAVGTGYYAVVNPLPPGDHVIELGGEICGEAPFSTSATYLLHVGG